MGYALAPQIHLATTLLIERPAKSLVDMAKHAVWTKAETLAGHRTSIDVRDGNGALLQHSRLNDKTINYEGPIMTVWAGLAPFVNIERTPLQLFLSTGLSLLCQMMNRVSSRNSKPSTRYLFTCINKCAVTVGSPSLQIFKRDGRQKNGAGNRNNAVRIRGTENRSDAGKRDNVFKAGEGPHICLHQEW
jgi:hypothetical protein